MLQQASEGARNLLLNCARVEVGDRLLILHEDPALGWYDMQVPMLVARVARELGVRVELRQVAERFSIEPDVIHSWHAGIHPGCRFAGRAADDPDRWSNTVFTSPRFVHFYTCGNDAPGEICWMVLDPTIRVDVVGKRRPVSRSIFRNS